jgi:hypothetical protein
MALFLISLFSAASASVTDWTTWTPIVTQDNNYILAPDFVDTVIYGTAPADSYTCPENNQW